MSTIDQHKSRFSIQEKPIIWLALICYVLIAGFTMFHHEPWGDELHSWTVAKGSGNFFNLIYNTRYEGHPPVWYIVLWTVSRFTHNFLFVQMVHLIAAISVVYLLLFYAPFKTLTKVLIAFGYYFLFEYTVLSRNYIIGLLACFLICIILHRDIKYKLVLYYGLLLLMSNTHLLALLLAGSIHLYFLISKIEGKQSRKDIILHILLGVLVFIPAICFILPPSDSELGVGASMGRWSMSQFAISIQTPFRAFVPMPAWWEYHFWNQQFLLSLHTKVGAFKVLYPLISFGFMGLGCYLLKNSKKSIVLFLVNIGLTFVVGNVYTLSTQRYSGFIFIGFLVAYWLLCYEKPVSVFKQRIINLLLIIQVTAGLFIVSRDIKYPFSNEFRVAELMNKVPAREKVVTDYWGLIAYSAYMDKPVYCIDMEETKSFNLWKMSMTRMRLYPYRYCKGLQHLFLNERIHTVYLLTPDDPEKLSMIDSRLFSSYHVQLVDEAVGAIEKDSDLYLYRISSL